jgi:glutamine amidotransferase
MKVALIDYGSGNLRSAAKAFEKVAGELAKNLDRGDVTVTTDAKAVDSATHIVLPGVGAFRDCRDGVFAIPGMMEALTRNVIERKKPFLGICVGMQLMARWGREHGDTEGFGWIDGEVARLTPSDASLKIPHMGWNDLRFDARSHPVLRSLAPGSYAYFVHSYAMRAQNPKDVLATVDYGGPVTAIVGRDNMIGTQFHPEKSQHVGQAVIAGFLKWRP